MQLNCKATLESSHGLGSYLENAESQVSSKTPLHRSTESSEQNTLLSRKQKPACLQGLHYFEFGAYSSAVPAALASGF